MNCLFFTLCPISEASSLAKVVHQRVNYHGTAKFVLRFRDHSRSTVFAERSENLPCYDVLLGPGLISCPPPSRRIMTSIVSSLQQRWTGAEASRPDQRITAVRSNRSASHHRPVERADPQVLEARDYPRSAGPRFDLRRADHYPQLAGRGEVPDLPMAQERSAHRRSHQDRYAHPVG